MVRRTGAGAEALDSARRASKQGVALEPAADIQAEDKVIGDDRPPVNGRELTSQDALLSFQYWDRSGPFAERKLPASRSNARKLPPTPGP